MSAGCASGRFIEFLLNVNQAVPLLHMHRGAHREDRTIDYVFGLLDIPWRYYCISILIGLVVWKCWRWEGGLLVGYAFLILAETVLIRKPFTGEHLKLELFWAWKQWNIQKNQIQPNVVMFIPAGVISGHLWKWKGIWFVAGLSVVIEVLQLITQRGLCEFDDVLHNTLGAVIDIGIVMLMRRVKEKEHR